MLIVFSHFSHEDDAVVERQALKALPGGDRVTLHVQHTKTAAANPIPREMRAKADAVIHFYANTNIDGSPDEYTNVRAVMRSGVGFDNLDIEAWGARGVPVFNVPDYGTSEVADHAIALMLSLTRGTATYNEAIRDDPAANWRHAKAPVVRRLRDLTFGVVGLGRIGLAAALRARAFGMQLAVYDPFLPSGTEIAVGAKRYRTLEDLMAASDVVSVHAPSSEETRGLVNAKALAASKPGLILINTARGAVVDLDALFDAMKSGKVAAAGLDVLPKEPADPSHKLIAAWRARAEWIEGRLVISPHAAFYSPPSVIDLRSFGVRTIYDCLTTGALQNCVNLEYLRRN